MQANCDLLDKPNGGTQIFSAMSIVDSGADKLCRKGAVVMSVIRRHPMLYLFTLVAVLILHWFLCYPAATSRGEPPMEPFWQFVAIYLAFLGVSLAPAFEDFSDFPLLRRVLLSFFSFSACLILAVAATNLAGPRPHIGHLAGYWGIIRYDLSMVIINTLQSSIIAIPFVFCFESVSRGFWNIIRKFDDKTVA